MDFTEKDVRIICDTVHDIFLNNTMLLDIPAPVYICGMTF
jgi:hypothetical protein